MWSTEDFVLGGLLTFLGMLLAVLLATVITGATTEILSREAVFQCEARNLDAVRKEFTTRVVCRPRRFGSDTLNLRSIP